MRFELAITCLVRIVRHADTVRSYAGQHASTINLGPEFPPVANWAAYVIEEAVARAERRAKLKP